MEKNVILSDGDIRIKIKRIAYQILESNLEEKQIFLAGINTNGCRLAGLLKEEIEKSGKIQVAVGQMKVDKKQLLSPVTSDFDLKDVSGQSVVLVDDVMNTGGVLIYGVKYLLDAPLKQFKTAVLIDRSHKKFPIKADFKGISLSTSLHDHVRVTFDAKGKITAHMD